MNGISQLTQVFPEDLLKIVSEHIDNVPWKYGWASNRSFEFTHWNHSFAKGSPENGLDISDNLPEPILRAWNHLKVNYLGDQTLLRCYTNSHTYGVEGYPHTDSKRAVDNTIVVYMNPEWRREWGGETTVYDGDTIVHAELPKYNKGLIFPGAAVHQARSVTRVCPAQRVTLMFKFALRNCDVQRDNIQRALEAVGGDKIKHSGRNLQTHLLNVYDILKAAGYGPTICGAGGLHSIFGTNAFTQQTLTAAHRDIVVKIIGESATRLVELFRDIRRPATLETALKTNTTSVTTNDGKSLTLTQDELNSLCAIEAANLSDQKCLKKYPLLKAKFKG
jgi:hypothetical protein